MTIFRSFRSTVNPFQSRQLPANLNLLVDPITGAPTGIQSPNANGPDGIWTPIDITAAQAASPTPAMLADINAIFRLNVPPYSRYVSTGTALVTSVDPSNFLSLTTGGTVSGPTTFTAGLTNNITITDPLTEQIPTQWTMNYVMTADSSNDVLNAFRIHYFPGGNHHSSHHSSALYGEASLFDTNPASIVDRAPAVIGVSGNQGAGTVVNAIDFYGHVDLNTSTGTVTNHYFLFQETSSAATNEYGAFFTAPVLIGPQTQTTRWNLDMGGSLGGNLSSTNYARFGAGNGAVSITSTGMWLFPGFNTGIGGGFGCTDLIVGNNGAQNATTATAAFLYFSSCAGTPTGVPSKQAAGRVPMVADTAANKIWFYINGSWKGVVVA